jgi:hypothetical protein
MQKDEQARLELEKAWEEYQPVLELEKKFGEVCYRWHAWYVNEKKKDKGDRIRFMWKSLGIPHTTAYHCMEIYARSIGKRKTPEIEHYTKEELARNEIRAANEARLEKFFKDCGFTFFIRQNCATNEYHFNVVFSALTEAEVRKLAGKVKPS